jgi:hypothetical protein
MSRAAKDTRGKPPVILVFGEHDNDRAAIRELLLALRSDLPNIEKRRDPLILMKSRNEATIRKNAQSMSAQVQRDSRRFDVRAIVCHADCDAIEPAHEALSDRIQERFSESGVAVAAAAPAFEMEAWLFLWPDAAPMVVASWSRPTTRKRQNVGIIENPKEAFRRAVRGNPRGKPPRDYEESDCPKILAKVRETGMIHREPDAVSKSYEMFRDAVLRLEP